MAGSGRRPRGQEAGMSNPGKHEITADVAAPAATVYDLVKNLSAWPRVFPNVLHAERVDGDSRHERARIWLIGGDGEQVHPWVAVRTFSPEEKRISYRQETAQHPLS